MEALEKEIQQKFSEFSKQQDPGLIHQALDLVEAAQRDAEPSHAASCRDALSASLTFLVELDQHIDPAWDQAKDPVRGVPSPVSGVRVYGTGEIDPADIPDPALRARYIQDLRANKEYRAYYNTQFRLRRIDESAMLFLERFIQRCYTASPQQRAEVDRLLAASSVTAERRNRLRNLVPRG
ncbi:hypothetical protein [Paraburkholderia sp. GAS334]|uniref:hypothetical protein n=1 Tax=Paraburkholderia sp. GAS334 TaxID=3035131 RepID=UPI003D1AB238